VNSLSIERRMILTFNNICFIVFEPIHLDLGGCFGFFCCCCCSCSSVIRGIEVQPGHYSGCYRLWLFVDEIMEMMWKFQQLLEKGADVSSFQKLRPHILKKMHLKHRLYLNSYTSSNTKYAWNATSDMVSQSKGNENAKRFAESVHFWKALEFTMTCYTNPGFYDEVSSAISAFINVALLGKPKIIASISLFQPLLTSMVHVDVSAALAVCLGAPLMSKLDWKVVRDTTETMQQLGYEKSKSHFDMDGVWHTYAFYTQIELERRVFEEGVVKFEFGIETMGSEATPFEIAETPKTCMNGDESKGDVVDGDGGGGGGNRFGVDTIGVYEISEPLIDPLLGNISFLKTYKKTGLSFYHEGKLFSTGMGGHFGSPPDEYGYRQIGYWFAGRPVDHTDDKYEEFYAQFKGKSEVERKGMWKEPWMANSETMLAALEEGEEEEREIDGEGGLGGTERSERDVSISTAKLGTLKEQDDDVDNVEIFGDVVGLRVPLGSRDAAEWMSAVRYARRIYAQSQIQGTSLAFLKDKLEEYRDAIDMDNVTLQPFRHFSDSDEKYKIRCILYNFAIDRIQLCTQNMMMSTLIELPYDYEVLSGQTGKQEERLKVIRKWCARLDIPPTTTTTVLQTMSSTMNFVMQYAENQAAGGNGNDENDLERLEEDYGVDQLAQDNSGIGSFMNTLRSNNAAANNLDDDSDFDSDSDSGSSDDPFKSSSSLTTATKKKNGRSGGLNKKKNSISPTTLILIGSLASAAIVAGAFILGKLMANRRE
jgi:hypothetical protein